MGINVHLQEASTSEVLGEDKVTGLALQGRHTLDCDMVVDLRRHQAERRNRPALRTDRRARHRRRQPHALGRRSEVYVVGECAQHRGRVYGLVAPLWEQAKVFAEHITGSNSQAAYHGSKLATKLKVMGVELASMGITEPAEDRRRDHPVHRAEEGHLQEADRARRAGWSAAS